MASATFIAHSSALSSSTDTSRRTRKSLLLKPCGLVPSLARALLFLSPTMETDILCLRAGASSDFVSL